MIHEIQHKLHKKLPKQNHLNYDLMWHISHMTIQGKFLGRNLSTKKFQRHASRGALAFITCLHFNVAQH